MMDKQQQQKQGLIPVKYRELFDIFTETDGLVLKEVLEQILKECNLDSETMNIIWELEGPSNGPITRTRFYKVLALIAWSQNGRSPSEKLFENFNGSEYPVPSIKNLNILKSFKTRHSPNGKSAILGLSYSQISQFDSINVELVPEKKGLFLKYSEYYVTSRRFNSKVTRRYKDFEALYELLLSRFTYRIIPRLPPKRFVSDGHFLEARRRSLHRWLTLICRHPIMYLDPVLSFFLVEQGPDVQYRIRDIFRRAPDEFMTSDFAENAKELMPSDNADFATNREQVKILVAVISRMKYLVDAENERMNLSSKDNDDLATQLKTLGTLSNGKISSDNWSVMQTGFTSISEKLCELSTRVQHQTHIEQMQVGERLGLLLDMLQGHRDLCDRLEKGLAQDHQVALAKMLSLKKRKIQGVLKGIDGESVEQLESKMLSQENIITNMEMRSDFSLYCVYMETQLVHVYLETLASIVSNMVSLKVKTQSEVSNIWTDIIPIVQKYFTSNISTNLTNGKHS